jgi:hypothetical protein
MVVPTGHETVPYLVAAPTMRIPDRVDDTVNAYLAFRAALLAVLAHNDANSTPPGLVKPPLSTRVFPNAFQVALGGGREPVFSHAHGGACA